MSAPAIDVYVTAVDVADVFADPTYQRPLDAGRARKIAEAWDRRLAGILEVSDRGDTTTPRYAVVDGQHRWAAAQHAAIAVMTLYNNRPGRKILVSTRTFGGTARNAHSTSDGDGRR